MLNDAGILDLIREAMWIGVWISAPILIVALIVGILVGLFQALTGIQELTLTFVPKLVCILITFWLCSNFMVSTLLTLFDQKLIPLILGY